MFSALIRSTFCQRFNGRRPEDESRRGAVIVLTAFLLIVMLAMVAFALDIGYILVAKTELQQAADSAAMAAVWELIDEQAPTGSLDPTSTIYDARQIALQYAGLNAVTGDSPLVDTNSGNSPSGDVVVGYLSDPSDPTVAMSYFNPVDYNAVKVKIRRTAAQNGEVQLFFGGVLGLSSVATEAEATAALVKEQIVGFKTPEDNDNLSILPFALDKQTWDAMLAGTGNDDFTWDSDTGAVVSGADSILEINLYPQGTGAPGNRGTVDIGHAGNSTADIARQITDGVSPADLAYHGGELKLDSSGELYLNGDTGISAGIKDELASIIGRPSIIPIFSQVTGPGNNATFTIVEFAGVRIVEVFLTGPPAGKRVMIQPANIVTEGVIFDDTASTSVSTYIYSKVWLVR